MQVISYPLLRIILESIATFYQYPRLAQATLTMSQLLFFLDSCSIVHQHSSSLSQIGVSEVEVNFWERLWVDEDKISEIEKKTGRQFRVTASNFDSGLVVSLDAPYLGASPDGKVIDVGCSSPFGLLEVKCPKTKFLVTSLDACSESSFFLENVNDETKLKCNHNYYAQVQGLMRVNGIRRCDFVVQTNKGLSIECIPFNDQHWNILKGTLKSYYVTHFLAKAAREP